MSKEIENLLNRTPLADVRVPEDTFKSPDYSGINWNALEKYLKVKETHTFFVDSSGFGRSSEPALTVDQFTAEVQDLIDSTDNRLVSCLSGVGQFQVYCTIYEV